jgi:acetyltransferase-like isoleucine patch superfamily enzyme
MVLPMLDFLKLSKRFFVFLLKRWIVRRRNPDCTIESGVRVSLDSHLSAPSRLHENVSFVDSEIGSYSYVGPNSVLDHAVVGRFCSIGSNVRIVYGRHPSRDFISSSPIFYSSQGQCGSSWLEENSDIFNEYKLVDGKSIRVGNDVWIGEGVLLLEGISIGDGSVIAAGSIVVGDVDPFSIVGGNPAKLIRYRFDDDERETIAASCWWNASEDIIKKSMHLCNTASLFIEEIKP